MFLSYLLIGTHNTVSSCEVTIPKKPPPCMVVFWYNKAMEEYAIKFQDGLLKDGRNGLQVEEALQQCVERLSQYQSKVLCRENSIAITHIETAILWLNKRTEDRKKRGVEGTYEV